MMAGLVFEVVMASIFLAGRPGATGQRAPAGFAPIAMGLCPPRIHPIGVPLTTTTPVNPASSTGVAVFVGGWAIGPSWLFGVTPIVGA